MSDADKHDDSDLTPEEQLRRDNEIEKLKLSAFYGMDFKKDGDLPPEVESEWLRYIKDFEEKFENADQIPVANRLGNPDFPLVSELKPEEIPGKLREVLTLLEQHGISLDTLSEVPENELYRFITEELFFEKIDDFVIEGMRLCFIYEEFHPNARYDIESTIVNFIEAMLSTEYREFMANQLAEKCETQHGISLTQQEALNKARVFGDSFDQFVINNLSGFEIEVFEERKEGWANFLLHYTALMGTQETEFKGKGHAKLKMSSLGYWDIYALDLPGFAL